MIDRSASRLDLRFAHHRRPSFNFKWLGLGPVTFYSVTYSRY